MIKYHVTFFAFVFQTIQTVDYEDELDLIVTVVTEMKHGDLQAKVKVYDNETGRFIRDIELDEPWAEVGHTRPVRPVAGISYWFSTGDSVISVSRGPFH